MALILLYSPCVATPLAVQGTEAHVERLARVVPSTRKNTDHHTRSGKWEDCPCWPLENSQNVEPFDFGFFNAQQGYYESIAACPNCSPVSAPVMPTGATSTWCACEDELLYSTRDGSTDYACSYPATKDLPPHVLKVTPYTVTGTEDCTVST